MVVPAMSLVGGTKLFLWTAALLLTNLLTAVIFTVTNQTYSGHLCPVYPSRDTLGNYNLYNLYDSDEPMVYRKRSNSNSLSSSNGSSSSRTLKELSRVQSLRSQLQLNPKSSIDVIQANCTVFNKEDKCRASQFEALLNLADSSLCRCEERSTITQVNACLLELQREKRLAEEKKKWEELEKQRQLPTIFAITPTYARTTQKVDLTSLCQTVMHVPNFIWVVIEDSLEKTPLVTDLLNRCKVESVHLNVRTPIKMRPRPGQEKNPSAYSRGVEQRNAGLNWIRNRCMEMGCRGVVYFMDDDNKYDLRLFDEMRKTVGVSVFPVGFSGGLKFEGPICSNGTATKWHVAWDPDRPFPIDMAGFAITVQEILDKPTVRVGFDEKGKPTKRGYLETSFLQNFATRKTVECRGYADEILVWHVKTQKPLIVYEGKHPSDPAFEV